MKYSNLMIIFIITTCSVVTQDSLMSRFKKFVCYIRSTIAQRQATYCHATCYHAIISTYQNQSLRAKYKQTMRELYGNTSHTLTSRKGHFSINSYNRNS